MRRRPGKLTPEESARYRRLAQGIDQEFASPAGQARLLRMARRRLHGLGPIELPVDWKRAGGRFRGNVPGLPVEGIGRTRREARADLTRALEALAESDPFAILEAFEERSRETVTVKFGAP